MKRTILGAVTCSLVLVALPVWARTMDENKDLCAHSDDQDVRINACTAIIESGQESNASLAIAYLNRGNAKDDNQDVDGAISDYTKAIQLKPDDADAYYNRGISRKHNGDLDGAIADYNKAIGLTPHKDYYTNRGNAKKLKGDID